MSTKKNSSPKSVKSRLPRGKRTLYIAVSAVSVLCLLAGTVFCYGYSLLDKINYTALEDFEEVSSIHAESEELGSLTEGTEEMEHFDPSTSQGPAISSADVQNILIIGADPRPGEKYGRSDTNMILSINRKEHTLKMTSILRDTYVSIPGKSSNRVNAAHSWGGPKLLIETIEANFKIKIDRYIKMDFSSFSKIIDLLGGVDITLTQAEANYFKNTLGISVPVGPNHFNGENALNYGRIRKIDSDFGRTQRQRNIIQSLINRFKTASPATMIRLLNEAFPLFQTNLTKNELLSLAGDSPAIMNYTISEMSLPQPNYYRYARINSRDGPMDVMIPDLDANNQALHKFIYGDK